MAGIESIVNADPFEVGERIARELRRQNPNPTMILMYPSMLDIVPAERAIQGVESVFGPQVPICGALSIDSMKLSSAFEFLDDRVFERGAVAIGLTDPTLEVISQANHGFPVIGEPFTVTRSTANRVYELDETPAWTSLTARLGLSEYSHPATVVTIGELAEELPEELWEDYGSRYIIRAGGAMNDADGSLYTATSVAEGTRLWLVRRDEKEMIEGIKRLVEQVGRRCQGQAAGGGVPRGLRAAWQAPGQPSPQGGGGQPHPGSTVSGRERALDGPVWRRGDDHARRTKPDPRVHNVAPRPRRAIAQRRARADHRVGEAEGP